VLGAVPPTMAWQDAKDGAAAAVAAERDALLAEIGKSEAVLEQHGVGRAEALVDAAGFPRNDVDVHAVRIARSELARLENDYREVMVRMEHALHSLHSKPTDDTSQAPAASGAAGRCTAGEGDRKAFAIIGEVTAGSPADTSGIMTDDQLLLFGSVSADNFQGMAGIATVVQHSVGKQVRVMVRRGDSLKLSGLTPRKWAGQGLLGCQIIPLGGV